MFARSTIVAAAVLAAPAAARAQTIPLDLNLGDLGVVDATVTVQQASSDAGQLLVSGTVTGTAILRGLAATIQPQPVTLKVGAVAATLTVTTNALVAALSDGTTANVAPITVVTSSVCTQGAATATVNPLLVTMSDGSTLTTTQVGLTLRTPPLSTLGAVVCLLDGLTRELARVLATGGAAADAINFLVQVLAQITALAL